MTGTEVGPINIRFDDLERGWDGTHEIQERAQRNNAFSDLYKERYNGKSLYDVQRELGQKIGTQFAEALGYKGDVYELPYFIRNNLEQRIINHNK